MERVIFKPNWIFELGTILLFTYPTRTASQPLFSTQVSYAAGVTPAGVAVGDFNLDDKPDVVAANAYSSTVSVLLGSGIGTLGSPVAYAVGTSAFFVAVGDFNLDGKPDVVATNYGSNTVSVLLGSGTGTFRTQVSYAVGAQPFCVAVGDFNLDGKPDVVATNAGSNTVSVLLGSGTGTFGTQVSYAVGSMPRNVAIGDFNLDGKPDVVVANLNSNTVSVLLGSGTGTLGSQTSYAVGTGPWDVAVGDFNLDGKPDIVVANNAGNTVSVLLGYGNGTFESQVVYAVGAAPLGVRVGDFNLDGKPDVVATNAGSNTVSVLLGSGTGTFGAQLVYATGSSPYGVAVGDFNLDGKADVVAANERGNTVSVLLNVYPTLPPTKHIRVLAINGGGIRGLIPATILQQISSKTGKQVPELFDFIIGASIGGILAAAYALPRTPSSTDRDQVKFNATDVLNILKDNAGFIFPKDKRSWGVFSAIYPRNNIDSLLADKCRVQGVDITLAHTLVPIALTSQNAVSNEPRLWFSCSKEFSTYYLKDVAGATSAAPTYFPPKFIKVQNKTQANAPDCKKYNLERKDGECQSRNLDGGLFANSPTLLTAFLLNQVMLNQTTSACTERYNFFGRELPSPVNLRLQLAALSPNSPPKLYLDEGIDITVVTLGTGHFIAPKVPTTPSLLQIKLTNVAIIAVSTLYLIALLTPIVISFIKKHRTPSPAHNGYNLQDSEDGAASRPASEDRAGSRDLFFWASVVVNGLILLCSSISFGFLIPHTETSIDGYTGFFTNDVIGGILTANEIKDITVARDVFGAITINPIFPNIKQIDLDATDAASLNMMINTTRGYVDRNPEAFNNLTECLLNSDKRIPKCDNASMFFSNDFIDIAGHGIIASPKPTVSEPGQESTIGSVVNMALDWWYS